MRRRLVAALLRGLGFGEQEPGLLSEHLDGDIGKPGFEVEHGRSERRPPTAERVVGQQERGRDLTLADELLEPVLVDAFRKPRVKRQPPHMREPSKDARQITGGWAVGSVAQPSQRRDAVRGVNREQRVERCDLLVGQGVNYGIGREPARHGPSRDPDPLDAGGRGQHHMVATQVLDDCEGDGGAALSAVRGPRGRGERASDVAPLKGAQSQASHRFPGVLEPGLGSTGIAGERGGSQPELLGDVPDKEVGHDPIVPHPEARVP